MLRNMLIVLMLLSPLPAKAQESAALDDAMAGLDQLFQQGGTPDEIFLYLRDVIRTSRVLGRAEPDYAIFYAMLADDIRNRQNNPVYALQIAEEGLELIAGDPNQADFATILKVSRSYALADMGRLDEAFAQAQLILPAYAQYFDQATVDDYAKDAARWGEGQLSDFNTSVTDLARKTLARANDQMEARAFGRALTLASAALVPMTAQLPEGDVRGVNATAEMMIARALGALGRHGQAGNAWLRALGYMTETPWTLTDPPVWWGQGLGSEDLRQTAFDIFEGLAGTAGIMGLADIERAALAQAAELAATPRARYSVLLRRARLALADKDPAAGLALLRESRDTAIEAGNDLDRRVAEFYIALTEARQAETDTGTIPPTAIIETAEAALAAYRTNLIAEEDFIYTSAATLLVRSEDTSTALDYARRALKTLQARIETRQDSGFGKTQARRDARSQVELFLQAAHLAASQQSDERLIVSDCPDPRAFVGCTVVKP
ncbi:MAG: hypothetical protein AB3N23_14565 [Paracoccaceae bacterium]